jgi:hypothetical protein
LLDHDPNERIPKYAGKRIRYAAVVVDLVNRKPVDIVRTQYSYLTFANDGKLDTKVLQKEGSLAANIISPGIRDREQPGVIDASHRFAKKQFDHEYKWEPTPHIESAIFEAVLGKLNPNDYEK